MDRRLLDAFSEEFFREMKSARSNPQAYDRASEQFEKKHGFTAYSSYQSYRSARNHRKKKGKR